MKPTMTIANPNRTDSTSVGLSGPASFVGFPDAATLPVAAIAGEGQGDRPPRPPLGPSRLDATVQLLGRRSADPGQPGQGPERVVVGIGSVGVEGGIAALGIRSELGQTALVVIGFRHRREAYATTANTNLPRIVHPAASRPHDSGEYTEHVVFTRFVY